MEYRVLGPLVILRDGVEAVLGSRKQRKLLARLLVDAGQVVNDDVLIDLLWDGAAASSNDLQVLVSRLRRALGTESIVRRGAGYAVVADAVDALVFSERVGEARALIARGEHTRAVGLLADALSAWSGPAYADFRYDDFAAAEIARLEELRVAATEDLVEARLALGRHREVIPELEALAVEHPFHEPFRRQLVVALYRSGRQADALAAYRAARTAFVEELGMEPSPEFRELERRVLRQDPLLGEGDPGGPPWAEEAGEARQPRPRGTRGLRTRTAAGIAAAVVLGAVVLLLLAWTRRDRADVVVAADSVAVLDARTARIATTIRLPFRPRALAASGDSVWVGAALTSALTRLDARTGKQVQVVGLEGSAPAGLVADAGGAWVATPAGRTVVLLERFEPGSDTPRSTIRLTGNAIFNTERYTPLAEGGGRLWASNGATEVVAFEPASGEQVARVVPDDGAGPIAWGGRDIWVAYTVSDSVTRVDGRRGTILATIVLAQSQQVPARVGTGLRGLADPSSLAYGFGSIWVAAYGIDSVIRIDPRRNSVVTTIPVGDGPNAITTGAGAVWVANRLGRSVTKIDPRRNAVAATVGLGRRAESLAVTGGRVWVAVQDR